MTDTDDPRGDLPEPTAAQDLASALLDGEADATEAAGSDDPAVVEARVAFERVARAVATPSPADADAREAAITAALRAAGPSPATLTAGDELDHRRRAGWGLKLAGVAAALLAVVALGGLLASGDDADDETAVSDAIDEGDDAGATAGAATESADDGQDLDSSTAPGLADLGAFDDLDALVAAAVGSSLESEEAAAGDAATTAPTTTTERGGGESGVPPADAVVCTAPASPSGAIIASSTATLEGRAVVVVVAEQADGRVVQIFDAATCAVVFEGPR
jgi:hypothetical protein